MKTIKRVFLPLLASFAAFGQVTVQTNIPASIAPNSNLLIEVKINKGGISNFSKYQMDVPNGVTVSEGDSRTGNFTFDANRAKIVWVSIPTDPEFVVSFKMNMGNTSGAAAFVHKFFYLEDGSKKEVEFDAINVTFDPSGATTVASLGGNAGNTTSSSTPATSTPTVAKTEPVKTETPVASNTTNNTNSTAKTTPTETKTTSPEPVKTNTVASEPVATKTEPVNTNTVATEPATVAKTTPEPVKTNPEPVKTSPTETPASTAKTSGSSGLVYKVQIGAYGADPGKSRFSGAGKVSISNEGGYYKVLVGSFNSKEEAVGKMNELKSAGFQGFVVSYQNGIRVK